jgi:hypothetical protein
VERVLQQPDPVASRSPLDDGLHQQPADAGGLGVGTYGDRPDAAHRSALVEEVRANHPPVGLGHHAPDGRMRAEGLDEPAGHVERREVAREAVTVVDACEGTVRNAGGRLVVAGLDAPQPHTRRAAGGGAIVGEGGVSGDRHLVSSV